MKLKIVSLIMAIMVAFSLLGTPVSVEAAGYGTSFATSVTYMNIGDDTASVYFEFFSEGATSVTQTYPAAQLAAGGAASLGVGAVFPSTFKGSAILSSSQPLVATAVQVPSSTTVKNRPLSNGFSSGATTVLIPTVLKGPTNSIFSVQNTGSSVATNVQVQFIPATAGTAHTDTIPSLAPGAAKYYDMGVYSAGGSSFSGSVRITSASQPLVASVMEALTTSDAVYAFEGTSETATKLYMPSAMCRSGSTQQTSYFAIQNTSDSTATDLTVEFSGTVDGSPYTNTVEYPDLGAGAKTSASGCGTSTDANPVGFIGSATVTSVSEPIVGMAKIAGTGAFIAAHLGQTQGYSRLAAPYVRFTYKFASYRSVPVVQRAYLAVQNVGDTELPENSVVVKFVGPDGTVQGTYTYPNVLAAGAKFSATPQNAGLPEFGYVPDATTGKPKSYGGGALIEGPAGSELAGVVRITTNTSAGDVAEDYNTIPAVVP